jgi:hypothetical protein
LSFLILQNRGGKKSLRPIKKVHRTSKKPFVFRRLVYVHRPETCHRPSVQKKPSYVRKAVRPSTAQKNRKFRSSLAPLAWEERRTPKSTRRRIDGHPRRRIPSPNVPSGGLHPLRCRDVAPSLIGRPGSPPCQISCTIYAHLHIPAPPAALLPCDPAPYLAKGLHLIPRRRRLVVGRAASHSTPPPFGGGSPLRSCGLIQRSQSPKESTPVRTHLLKHLG